MAADAPFAPSYGSGQSVTPAAASANIGLQTQPKQIRIVNTGAAAASVRTYNARSATEKAAIAVADAVLDYLIPAGVITIISKDPVHDRLAHISATGTTLHIIQGEGR